MRSLVLMQWYYLGSSNEVGRSMKSWKASRRTLSQLHVVEQRPDHASMLAISASKQVPETSR